MEQLTQGNTGTAPFGWRSPAQRLLILVTARYFLLLMGLLVLVVELVETLLLARAEMFRGVVAILIMIILVPLLFWTVKRERQLRQDIIDASQESTLDGNLVSPAALSSVRLAEHIATRYLLLGLGVLALMWEIVHGFWLKDDGLVMGMVGVGLVAMLVPAMMWVINKEKYLRRDLAQANQQIQNRSREIKALNKMFQQHLSEQYSKGYMTPELPEPQAGYMSLSNPGEAKQPTEVSRRNRPQPVQDRSPHRKRPLHFIPDFGGPFIPKVVEWSFHRQDAEEQNPDTNASTGRKDDRGDTSTRHQN